MSQTVAIKCPRCGCDLPAHSLIGACPRCAAAVLQATQTEIPDESGSKHAFVPPSVEGLSSLFPQLEVIEFIGQGGMGAVYKARQRDLDRFVALKILPPDIGTHAAFAERFTREARALARLSHPGIVTIYDFGRVNGSNAREGQMYFFLMEFVDGVTLRKLLEGHRIASREALAIVPQICDALQYAHDQGIIHRDIKPDNILVDRRGRVKVADFGLAKLMSGDVQAIASPGLSVSHGDSLTNQQILGTPSYMAPEQKEHPEEVDHRADIYALGVVFYQMLTGELPAQALQPPSKKVVIDVRLDEVVLHALERDPERRYQQAGEIKTAVETIATAAGTRESEAGLRAREVEAPREAKRSAWSVFVAGALGVLLLEFAAIAFRDPAFETILLGAAATGLAVLLFVLARKRWLPDLLVVFVTLFLLWLAVGATVTGAIVLGATAGVLGLTAVLVFLRRTRLPTGFLPTSSLVFASVFGLSTLITALLPVSYASTSRVRIVPVTTAPEEKRKNQTEEALRTPLQRDREQLTVTLNQTGPYWAESAPKALQRPVPYDPFRLQTELEIIRSGPVLGRVINKLDLTSQWGKKYGNRGSLTLYQTLPLLRKRIDLRAVVPSHLIEIRAFSEDPKEAAMLANETARAYQAEYSTPEHAAVDSRGIRVEIVDQAVPPVRSVRPNVPLNLTFGSLAGLLFGTLAGAIRSGMLARK